MGKYTKEESIKKCKKWAMDNYEKGADAIVECWDDSDWDRVWDEEGSFTKMMKAVKESAGLWVEQNLNARWGEDTDECLNMLK